MRKTKKVFKFTSRGFMGSRYVSKLYASAYHCNCAAEGHSDVEFYEGEVIWSKVDSIYNKNTIGEVK